MQKKKKCLLNLNSFAWCSTGDFCCCWRTKCDFSWWRCLRPTSKMRWCDTQSVRCVFFHTPKCVRWVQLSSLLRVFSTYLKLGLKTKVNLSAAVTVYDDAVLVVVVSLHAMFASAMHTLVAQWCFLLLLSSFLPSLSNIPVARHALVRRLCDAICVQRCFFFRSFVRHTHSFRHTIGYIELCSDENDYECFFRWYFSDFFV